MLTDTGRLQIQPSNLPEDFLTIFHAFSALTLLAGWQEEHPARKN